MLWIDSRGKPEEERRALLEEQIQQYANPEGCRAMVRHYVNQYVAEEKKRGQNT